MICFYKITLLRAIRLNDAIMNKTTILFIILSYSLPVAATNVYRIVDENGRVHYSQIPPHKDAEKVKLKGAGDSNGQSGNIDQATLQERQKRYSEYLESERLERKQKRDQQKQEKAKRTANCHSIRAELEDMNQGGVLYYDLDENGERVYIDRSRVEAKKKRLRKYLDDNCRSIVKIN